ncbi:MAG: GSCFA domain-containing protein [Bacteroidales bacterium]|nr:GSCFA domain-containing protein [Bacteroidales bacterium]
MLKLLTPVDAGRSRVGLSYDDRILVLGSCFADHIGRKLLEAGFSACVNPFGTLYNPVSVCNATARLASGTPFSEADCVEVGAGSGLTGSFWCHTLAARPTADAFLQDANAALAEASAFFRGCNKVILTLGTAWCWRSRATGEVVANCLKRPAAEFTRERLTVPAVTDLLEKLVTGFPDKQFILTVSPIRHLKESAHGNQISKSILLLAIENLTSNQELAQRLDYFPAYEILLDELRDYRWYAPDLVHPSVPAVDYLWERFTDFALVEGEKEKLLAAEKLFRSSQHRPLH